MLAGLGALAWAAAANAAANLARLNINTGFDFLTRPAGFAIGQHLIAYSEASSYFAAFLVAVAPYDLVVAQIYTMNGFEPLAWGGVALVAARALGRGSGGPELYWLGPIAGLGVLNKHSAALQTPVLWHLLLNVIRSAISRSADLTT